jgi:hypothetical protein
MTVFRYRPVSGASTFGEPTTLAKAAKALLTLRPQFPQIEIERVQVLPIGRRYWRWRNRRWSIDNHYEPTERDLARWKPVR